MSEIIKKSDVSEKDVLKYIIDGAKEAERSLDLMNKQLIETAKISKTSLSKSGKLSNAAEIKATEQAIKQANIQYERKLKLEQQELNNQKLLEKARVEQIKLEKAREKNIDDFNKKEEQKIKLLEKEEQQQTRLSSVYARVDKKLAGLTREYRDLAIRKELGLKLTDAEIKRYTFLQQKIEKYDRAFKITDASMGKHHRLIGQYTSGFNGLGNSVNQLTREMPAFANSVQTGFMALSNNLPIFFDEISKIKKANIELAASGKPTESVFKQLGKSVFSLGTLLSVGVTLLTLYGAKLIEFVFTNRQANKELEKRNKQQKLINEQSEKARDFIGKESAEFVGYILHLKNTNQNSSKRSKLITEINEKYGTTLKNLKNENEFQKSLNQSIKDYIQLQVQRYNIEVNKTNIENNLKNRYKLTQEIRKEEKELAKQRIYYQDLLNRGGLSASDYKKIEQESNVVFQSRLDNISKLKKEIEDSDKRLEKYNFYIEDSALKIGKLGFNAKETADNVKELKTTFDELNLTLEDQRNILLEIESLQINRRVAGLELEIENELNLRRKAAENRGEVETKLVTDLINKETDLRIVEIEHRYALEKQQLKEALDTEIKDKQEALKKERDELIKQGGNKKEIEKNYQDKLKELEAYRLKQVEINNLKIIKLELEKQQELIGLDEERAERLKQITQELNDLQEKFDEKQLEAQKKEKEKTDKNLKERFENQRKYFDLITNYFIKRSNERIAQIDKEIQASEKQQDVLTELAKNGNITAQQSLAEQQKITNEANKKKIAEQKKQERIKLIETGYSVYTSKVEAGDKNPLFSTIKDITLLNQFLAALPTFMEGTEDTGKNGQGIDGKGGFISILHPNERVLTKEQNEKIGSLANDKVATIVHDFNAGKLVHLSNSAIAGNSFDILPLMNEIKSLKQVLIDKPVTNIAMGEITQSIMQIIEKTQKGNNIQKTIYNIRK